MTRFFGVSLASGILFAFLDVLVNANPLAQRLLLPYAPIVKSSVNAPLGLLIDVILGFAMVFLFDLLSQSLPDKTRLQKGLSFGAVIWFFRVAMGAASQLVMFNILSATLVYLLFSGLVEMLILGLFVARFSNASSQCFYRGGTTMFL